MGLRVADYDAMNMKLFLLDNSLYFTCPELTGNHLLGINTETLSQDLPDANIEESENFNYFEMISEHKPPPLASAPLRASRKRFCKAHPRSCLRGCAFNHIAARQWG